MARGYERTDTRTTGAAAPSHSHAVDEGADVLRQTSPEQDRRYRELAEKLDLGTLTSAEQQELETLVAESEQLMLENSRALLRHRDPAAFAAAVREEQRVRRWTSRRRRLEHL